MIGKALWLRIWISRLPKDLRVLILAFLPLPTVPEEWHSAIEQRYRRNIRVEVTSISRIYYIGKDTLNQCSHNNGDEPAMIYFDTDKIWVKDGIAFRANGNPNKVTPFSTAYLDFKQRLHKLDAPASTRQTHNTMTEYWAVEGKYHRLDAPAIITTDLQRRVTGEEWYKCGKHHRLDGPAVVSEEYPMQQYFVADKFHRIRGPANGRDWFCHGKRHRLGGPAEIAAYEAWYQWGKYHRMDGPAITNCLGIDIWYQYGECHRENGPAIEPDGTNQTPCEWWLFGVQYLREEYDAANAAITARRQHLEQTVGSQLHDYVAMKRWFTSRKDPRGVAWWISV